MSQYDLYQQLIDLAKNNNTRISISSSVRDSQSGTLDDFKLKVKDIKAILTIIDRNNHKILSLRDTLIHNASAKKEQQTNNAITDTLSQNSELMVSVRALIEVVDTLIDVEQRERKDEPETLSKVYQKKHLLEQITRIMKESSKIEVLYKRWTVAEAARNIQLFDNKIDQNEAIKIASSQNGYSNFLKQKQLGGVSLKMRHRIEDIIQKNRAIRRLQRSILQNLEMMKQIAVMVKEQGEMLDCIEENMLEAKDYVGKANTVLQEEKKLHQKNRKKMCCIIFVGIAILAMFLVPIIVKATKKK